MPVRTQLKRTDADFEDFEVFVYGVKQDPNRLISADAEKGEVRRYQTGADGKILSTSGEEPPRELAVGTVAIRPRREPEAATIVRKAPARTRKAE